MEKINQKQIVFINEYLTNGLNALQAYLIAYPNASYATAHTNSANLLAKTSIRQYIDSHQKDLAIRNEITKD